MNCYCLPHDYTICSNPTQTHDWVPSHFPVHDRHSAKRERETEKFLRELIINKLRYICESRLLRSWVRIPPGAWIFVCCECCVLSGRGLCDELITRPEEYYRPWCVVVCDLETLRIGAPYVYMTLVT
jgi:hypothetical protein